MFIHSQLAFCWPGLACPGQSSKWVYFNPFLSMQLSLLPDCAPLSLAHQSLIGFDCLCKEQRHSGHFLLLLFCIFPQRQAFVFAAFNLWP